MDRYISVRPYTPFGPPQKIGVPPVINGKVHSDAISRISRALDVLPWQLEALLAESGIIVSDDVPAIQEVTHG